MSTDILTGTEAAPAESANASPSSEPSSQASTSTSEASSWLPAEYAENAAFKDFKSIEGLAKSYDHLNRERGRSVRIPGEDAGKEDLDKFYAHLTSVKGVMRKPDVDNQDAMNQFYNSLGRPAEPSGYEIDLGEDNALLDATALDNFKKVGHELGLTTNQLKKVVEFDIQRVRQQKEADVNSATDAISVLQKRWGNEYNNRIAGAKAAFRTYQEQFPEGFSELERVAKNNPALVAILSDIGRTMSEKGFINAPHAYGGDTPEEAKIKIEEIRSNKDHPYHKGDLDAKTKMNRYYQTAYPDPPQV